MNIRATANGAAIERDRFEALSKRLELLLP
jgi:hypothetical protein